MKDVTIVISAPEAVAGEIEKFKHVLTVGNECALQRFVDFLQGEETLRARLSSKQMTPGDSCRPGKRAANDWVR